MHWLIDIAAATILLFFFLAGWRKGFLLSLLGIVRIVASYAIAYLAGRYLGSWLGGIANRPRIVAIPIVAGLAFVAVNFLFHVAMHEVRLHRHQRKKKRDEEKSPHPWPGSLGGGVLGMAGGLFSTILLFWLCDLFLVGVAGRPIPGADRALTARIARRAVYEGAYRIASRTGDPSQAAAMARIASNPAKGVEHIETVLSAPSVQQILADRQFAQDLLSGDPARIEHNASMQQIFNDRAVLESLRHLGILSGAETRPALCEKLSRFGRNDTIRSAMENLKAKDLLHADQLGRLVRDPDFDRIVAELAK